jgi:hypothetical protein
MPYDIYINISILTYSFTLTLTLNFNSVDFNKHNVCTLSPDDGTAIPKHTQQILYLTEIHGEILSCCLQNYCSSCIMTIYLVAKIFKL